MANGEKIYVADKETLDKCYNILAAEPVYGFIEHMNILSPTERIEYIGMNHDFIPVSRNKETGGLKLNSWADFPVIKANKPYMVKSDGVPDYRLNENDYTKKEDGSESDVSNTAYAGGAFSWLMKVYKYEKTIGADRTVLFSFTKRAGYEPVGFVDSDNKELDGVWIPMFYGSLVGDTNPKMVSLSGLQPEYSKNTAEQKAAIDRVSTRARFLGGPIVETIIDLLMLFAGTSNMQETYGYGNSHGYDESLAPTNGVKQNAVIGGGQFYGTDDGKTLNKIFHSIVLGSYQQWMKDPYELVVNGRVKVSKNYTYDITGASYDDTGNTVSNAVGTETIYPARYQSVPGYGSVPIIDFAKGSSLTGSCDSLWYSNIQNTFTAVTHRFGGVGDGLNAGPRCRLWSRPATSVYWSLGAAVLLLPPVGTSAF